MFRRSASYVGINSTERGREVTVSSDYDRDGSAFGHQKHAFFCWALIMKKL